MLPTEHTEEHGKGERSRTGIRRPSSGALGVCPKQAGLCFSALAHCLTEPGFVSLNDCRTHLLDFLVQKRNRLDVRNRRGSLRRR